MTKGRAVASGFSDLLTEEQEELLAARIDAAIAEYGEALLAHMRELHRVAVAREREACARAAENALLPKRYQWGSDALEAFNFGLKRSAAAIRARGKR